MNECFIPDSDGPYQIHKDNTIQNKKIYILQKGFEISISSIQSLLRDAYQSSDMCIEGYIQMYRIQYIQIRVRDVQTFPRAPFMRAPSSGSHSRHRAVCASLLCCDSGLIIW